MYLVGGAVRDRLLGRPVGERDWVVVGATPAELTAQGYAAVGKDFPVFLHPQTREEYALARQERKVAPGYHGFRTVFSPDVTLEEDLKRRDLTINAMAEDSGGGIVDPYGGQRDLENRCCAMFRRPSSRIRYGCCGSRALLRASTMRVFILPPKRRRSWRT